MLPCEYAVSVAAPTLKSVGPIIMGKFDWDVLGSTEHSVLAVAIFTFHQLLDSFLVTESVKGRSTVMAQSSIEGWIIQTLMWLLKCDDYPSWNHPILQFNSMITINFSGELLDRSIFFWNSWEQDVTFGPFYHFRTCCFWLWNCLLKKQNNNNENQTGL